MFKDIADFEKVTNGLGVINFTDGTSVRVSVHDDGKANEQIETLKKELTRMSTLNKLKDEKINELTSQINRQTQALTDRNIRIEKLENEIAKIKGVRNVEPVEYRFEGFVEWNESLKKAFDIQKEVKIPEDGIGIITMSRIDYARIFTVVDHTYVNPFLKFDFSDHKTINGFLKNYFQVRSGGDLVNMIEALEKSYKLFNDRSTRYERAGVTMNYLFTHWEGLGSLTRDEEEELAKYLWDREHPFSYTIVAKPNEEDSSIMEYYVVFNSAPEYIGK